MNRNVATPKEDGIEHVLPVYEDRLAGISAILINSAIEATTDGVTGVIVPDPEGLQIAVAAARVTVPLKLTGPEIRVLRKTMGIQARELAGHLDVTPETFSRWENGREQIATNPERLLRIRVFQCLRDKAPGVVAKTEDILNMKIVHLRLANRPLILKFERVRVLREGGLEPAWGYLGLDEEMREPIKRIA